MAPSDGFSVTSNGPSMFALHGELDMSTRPVLDEAIAYAVAAGGPLVLDLSELTFMDSTGIHAVVQALHSMPSGCLLLHGVHGVIEKVLDIAGIAAMPRLHVIRCTELAAA